MSNTVANSAADLIPFTGFYALSSGSGSFLLIDTNLIYDNGLIAYEASVTISMDGVSSDRYDFVQCCTFDPTTNTLTVNRGTAVAARVVLSNIDAGGMVASLSGTVGSATVTGTSPFNPIQIGVFAASYGQVLQTAEGPLLVTRLKIGADGSVSYDGGTGLQPVPQYAFNYAMFVIQFVAGGQTVTYEMGTEPGGGRVAGNSADGTVLISIGKVTSWPPAQAKSTPQLAEAHA